METDPRKGHQKIEDFEIAQKVLIDDGSLDKTRLDAIYWSNIAKSQLKFLPESQFNKLLVKLTDYVVARVS